MTEARGVRLRKRPRTGDLAIRGIVTTIVILAACTSSNGPASTTQEDIVAVSRMLVTLDRLSADGDLEGLLEHVSEDAVFMLPDEAAIIGKRQIGVRYRELGAAFNLEVSHEPLETDVFGEIIINRGNATGTLQPRSGAAPITFDTKYLFVIRRNSEGSLRIWRAIFNNNPRER